MAFDPTPAAASLTPVAMLPTPVARVPAVVRSPATEAAMILTMAGAHDARAGTVPATVRMRFAQAFRQLLASRPVRVA